MVFRTIASFPGAGAMLCRLLISAWGVGLAFLANAVSFLAVITALAAMRVMPTLKIRHDVGLLGGIDEGVRFIRSSSSVLWVLVTLAVLSVFAMNFNVFVPVLARAQLRLGASGFGFLLAAQGAGALLGSLLVAGTGARGPRPAFLAWGALLLCGGLIALSCVAHPAAAAVELFVAGMGMVLFTATANSTVQLETPDSLRGRVMSIYALVFNGLAPFGALMMGAIIDAWGPQAGMFVGGAVGLAGTVAVRGLIRRFGAPAVVPG